MSSWNVNPCKNGHNSHPSGADEHGRKDGRFFLGGWSDIDVQRSVVELSSKLHHDWNFVLAMPYKKSASAVLVAQMGDEFICPNCGSHGARDRFRFGRILQEDRCFCTRGAVRSIGEAIDRKFMFEKVRCKGRLRGKH